ncbi:unnamed protein product [Caenorhabditis nigoni]
MGRRSVKKPLISKKNQAARMKWAEDYLNWTRQDWNKVLWSDESKVMFFGSDEIQWIRRPVGSRYDPKYQLSTHGGPLHRVKGIIDQHVYKDIVQNQILPHLKSIGRGILYQQDNDPNHTDLLVKNQDELGWDQWDGDPIRLETIHSIQGNIQELRGKSVAIDFQCFLERGLAKRGLRTAPVNEETDYVPFVDKKIQALLAMECHVVMSTDDHLRHQNQNEQDREQEARNRDEGTMISESSVDNTIDFYRKVKNVDVVVAPYEGSAQMAYLLQAGLVDAVVTSKTNLVLFGCKQIYSIWDLETGDCSVYQKSGLKKCFSGELGGEELDFVKFRRICILAGCGYLQADHPGISFYTATKLIASASAVKVREMILEISERLKQKDVRKKIKNNAFIERFERAENKLKYQPIFDTVEKCQKPLTPYPILEIDIDDEIIEMPESLETPSPICLSAGNITTQRAAVRLAMGNRQKGNIVQNRFLLPNPIPEWSIFAEHYERKGAKQERVAKNYEFWAAVSANTATCIGVISLLIGTVRPSWQPWANAALYGSVLGFMVGVICQGLLCILVSNRSNVANLWAIFGTQVGTIGAFAVAVAATPWGIASTIISLIFFLLYYCWIVPIARKHFVNCPEERRRR